MAPIAPPRYVVAPATVPKKFGIFSVSSIIDVNDVHELNGVVYEPTYCGPAAITEVGCPSGPALFGNPKEYSSGDSEVIGLPFAVVGSWECSPIGHWDDAQDRATAALLDGEERAVERAIERAEAGNTSTFQGATDLTPTPGTPVSITSGIALLEAYAGLNFNGQGVIHANPREVTFMANNVLLDELPASANFLMTNLGTLVASEGGMSGNVSPTGVVTATANHWIYVTSRPTIRRSGIIFTPTDRRAGLNTGTNDLAMLAERVYVVAWSCQAAAVLVTTI